MVMSGQDKEAMVEAAAHKVVEVQLGTEMDLEGFLQHDAVLSEGNKQYQNFLQKMSDVPIDENERIRRDKILYMAQFIDEEQAQDIVAALVEFDRYHLSSQPILSLVLALCSVGKAYENRTAAFLDSFSRRDIRIDSRDYNQRGRGYGNGKSEASPLA